MSDSLRWLKADASEKRDAGQSRGVRIARVFLPILAVVLLAGSVIWAQMGPDVEVKKMDLKEVQNTLETARFTSTDSEGRPFVIEADKVLQQDPTTMTATLAKPKGEITMKEGDLLSVTANDGVYDHPNQKLHLQGDVVLNQNKDMTMKTENLDVNLMNKSAVGTAPVHGTSTNGNALEAQGLQLSPGASTLTFTGPAKLILAPQKKTEKAVQ